MPADFQRLSRLLSLSAENRLITNIGNSATDFTSDGGLTYADNALVRIGSDGDGVSTLNSAGVAINTPLANVLIGTPVTPVAIAADSVIKSNITASGDYLIVVNKGGNSHMAFMADASTGDTIVQATSGQSFDVYIAGAKEIDYSTGAMAFQQATTISTTATTLALSPATDLILKNGLNFIGDTANAKMTVGLTINQGAADDEIFSLKSGGDVAHGMTDLTETDTFALMKKDRVSGGLDLFSLQGQVGADSMFLRGVAAAANTTKSTAGVAAIHLWSAIKSGTTDASVGANGNILIVSDRGSVKAIIDAEGDLHLDAAGGAGNAVLGGTGTAVEHSTETVRGYNTYDDEEDWKMARALKASLIPGDPIEERFKGLIDHYKPLLQEGRLITYNEDGHHFIAMKRLAMFQLDAIWQLGEMISRTNECLLETRNKLFAIEGEDNSKFSSNK